MALGQPVGLALGAAVPPLFIDGSIKGVDNLIILHFGLGVFAAGAILCIRPAPPTPPSCTAESATGSHQGTMFDSVKTLARKQGYCQLLLIFSLSVGTIQVRAHPFRCPYQVARIRTGCMPSMIQRASTVATCCHIERARHTTYLNLIRTATVQRLVGDSDARCGPCLVIVIIPCKRRNYLPMWTCIASVIVDPSRRSPAVVSPRVIATLPTK
jgi:hypothetical protein